MSNNEINHSKIHAVQASATAFIKSIADINKLWDVEFTARTEAVNELIKSGYDIHVLFYKSMSSVASQYEKSCKMLDAIKPKLETAEKEGLFDKDNVTEVKENSEKLLENIKSGKEHNENIQAYIIFHKRDIEAEKLKVAEVNEGKNFRAMVKGVAGGGSTGIALTVALATGATLGTGGTLLLGATGGSAIAGGIAKLKGRKRTENMKKVVEDLDKSANI